MSKSAMTIFGLMIGAALLVGLFLYLKTKQPEWIEAVFTYVKAQLGM